MRKALIEKNKRKKAQAQKEYSAGKKITKPTRIYNMCRCCGDNGAFMRRFDLCRNCFRQMARAGEIPGVTKSSW